MSIQQTKKQSDLEKRLRLLRQQVYGRVSEDPVRSEGRVTRNSDTLIHRYTDTSGTPNNSSSFKSDIIYLRQDLIKISILASAAFMIQVILYFYLQNNILKLNLF